MFFKFKENQIFYQTINSYPKYIFTFVSASGGDFKILLNNPVKTGTAASIREDSFNKTEINVDRTGTNVVYPFMDKTSGKLWFSTISQSSYDLLQFGSRITGSYLQYETINRDFISNSSNSIYKSLKNIWNSQRSLNNDFNFDNFPTSSAVILIPKQYYNGTIKKGSVQAGIVNGRIGPLTETAVRIAQDIYKDGVLRITQDGMPSSHLSSTIGEKVGYILYDYGLVLFISSTIYTYDPGSQEASIWTMANNFTWSSGTDAVANWKWFSDSEMCSEEYNKCYSFLSFEGINKIQNLTMLCDLPKGKLNNSNNPTFIEYSQNIFLTQTTESTFVENTNLEINNIVSSSFNIDDDNFSKETYISYIYIFDKNKEVIGVAKLANPIRKTESRDYTIKISYDF